MEENLLLTCIIVLKLVGISDASAKLTVGQQLIKIGEPLKLECSFSNKQSRGIPKPTRWTGGRINHVLCFDGVPTDPRYQQEIETKDTIALNIKNTSEFDLQCPYTCHVGSEYSETVLEVNEQNFLHLPSKNTTMIDYKSENEKYLLDVHFYKVFPVPVCKICEKNTQLPESQRRKSDIFYNVSYHLESNEPLHDCGRQTIMVECKIGSETQIYHKDHQFECKVKDGQTNSQVNIIITFVVAVVVLLVLVGVVFGFLRYKKRQKGEKTEDTSKGSEMFLNEKKGSLSKECSTVDETMVPLSTTN